MDARHVLAPRRIVSRRSCPPHLICIVFACATLVLVESNSISQVSRIARQPMFRATASTPSRNLQPPASPRFRAETEHFVVLAADQRLAGQVAAEAERFRKELAMEWLGTPLGPWTDKCPIEVELGMHAGGETSFAFEMDETGRGRPVSWQMKIFGPPDRLLDAVLPHEITHTIFATHFGRPLPRWADEGACTTVEHESERYKNHRMLMDFLTAQPSRGIPFNRMFTMKNYPDDILPLYAQGYSLARFLISQKGRRYFLDYVAAGMQAESSAAILHAWDTTTEKFYGYEDLSDLQIAWLGWVRDGSKDVPTSRIAATIAPPMPAVNTNAAAPMFDNSPTATTASFNSVVMNEEPKLGGKPDGSWYVRQMQGGGTRVAANRESLSLQKDDGVTTPDSTRLSDRKPKPVRDDSRLNLPPAPTTVWR